MTRVGLVAHTTTRKTYSNHLKMVIIINCIYVYNLKTPKNLKIITGPYCNSIELAETKLCVGIYYSKMSVLKNV